MELVLTYHWWLAEPSPFVTVTCNVVAGSFIHTEEFTGDEISKAGCTITSAVLELALQPALVTLM